MSDADRIDAAMLPGATTTDKWGITNRKYVLAIALFIEGDAIIVVLSLFTEVSTTDHFPLD